ncbi:hypothetical protein GWI33_007251 [Rhynchophorus ferrugineus]|uniref:Uncharacterized protein n=1 Tax=Rhynchophorus ferrugineus TaxID=354439 RepID=A0A834MD66_RHYFE|nr:hypothetical protein GWI33_007251 [Rhynchophorus ferrugineus]
MTGVTISDIISFSISYEQEQEHLEKLLREAGYGQPFEKEQLEDNESDKDEQNFQETVNHESEPEKEISDTDETNIVAASRKGRNVILASSKHHHDEIDKQIDDKCKPVIITAYNDTKGGFDVVEKHYVTRMHLKYYEVAHNIILYNVEHRRNKSFCNIYC